MSLAVDHSKPSPEWCEGWYSAVDGAEYISNPYHGIKQEYQYSQWADGYIAYLDMLCGEED